MDAFGLMATLGASSITGVVAILSALLASRHASRSQKEQRLHERAMHTHSTMQERGEELYVLAAQFEKNVFVTHMPLYSVMKGEVSYNDYLDIVNGLNFSEKYDHNRMELLVEVYFPALRIQYKKMREKLELHNKVVSEHKSAYLSGEFEARHFLTPFQRAQLAFENEMNTMKEMISIEVRENLTHLSPQK